MCVESRRFFFSNFFSKRSMSQVAEVVNPGFKLETAKGLPKNGFRRVDRFALTRDCVAELVNPAIELEVTKSSPHSQHHRVDRFVRYGVDKVMEGHKKFVSMLTPGKSRYGRVSHFTMSRPRKSVDGTISLPPTVKPGSYRHVDYFRGSGIVKGEGNSGGGTVTDMSNFGMNPKQEFREVRVKRQSKPKVEPIKQEWNKKLHPLDRKTSAEIMRMKVQKEEATVEMQANKEYKAKQKEEQDRKKQKEYETIKNYNPWGQPSAGVPKVTNGKLCAQLNEIGDKSQADMWLLLTGREDLVDKYPRVKSGCKRMKNEEDLSESEKKKLRKEKERKEYYVKYLERQKLKKKKGSFDTKEKEVVPIDFIWGRTDVPRNMSGKLLPRMRQLYQLDIGKNCNQSFGTYFSVADKMAQLPEHRPLRGTVDPNSYQTWGKPGSAAIMRNTSNRNTSTVVMPRSAAVSRLHDKLLEMYVAPPTTTMREAPPTTTMKEAPTTMREAGVQCG